VPKPPPSAASASPGTAASPAGGDGTVRGDRGAGRRHRLSPAERRASIVAAATEVFARAGYQRARMSDVAARVGVTEPVIFQNFGSKASLYAAVLLQAGEHAQQVIGELAQQGSSAADVLARVLSPRHMDELHAGDHPGVIFADAMSLTTDPEIGAAARSAVTALAQTLAGLVAEGQRAGDIRAGTSPDAAAWSVLSLLASHGFRRAVMPDRERLEGQVSQTFLAALVAPAHRGGQA
jgi:AcrR family transcriptional regulator